MRCPRTCFRDQPPGKAGDILSDSGICRSPGSAASTRDRNRSLSSLICLAQVYQSGIFARDIARPRGSGGVSTPEPASINPKAYNEAMEITVEGTGLEVLDLRADIAF